MDELADRAKRTRLNFSLSHFIDCFQTQESLRWKEVYEDSRTS